MSTIQNSLRSAVRGQVWLPGDPEFDVTRRPWNVAIEQPVLAVVEAADADDVAALVRHARAAGVSVATQPSGHGASGSTDGSILLRTRQLDTLEVDAAARRARIGAGVRSGEVQAAAAPHGLTGLPGSSPVVNVTGSTIGGGISWFGRARGWAADSVTAFDVVDAEGQQRHVTAESDADLFWALRGAGGDLAIVTAIEVTLHPVPELYGGRVLWSAEHSAEVIEVYRQLTADAPNELTVWLDQLHFPGADPMVAMDATYLGPENEARELLAAIDGLPKPMSDSRETMSSAELGKITAEPTDPSPGMSRGELMTELSDAAVKVLLAEPIAPLLSVQLRHLGGAFAQPSDSPHGPLTEAFLLYLFGIHTPETAEAITVKQRELAEALPVSGRKPFTFLNPDETPADAFSPEVLTRLRAIKRDQDPNNVFRSNFPLAK